VVFYACRSAANSLPDYGAVPNFQMTDSEGRGFDSRSLQRKVWVADFIYTNCPGPCSRMSSQMHRLAQRLKGDPDVRLVSISVDPARDTPPVLKEFARHFGGPTPQWIFLTGSPETVHGLAYVTFHVGDVIGRMDHSTRFSLVDRHSHIRGYYSTFDQEGMSSLLRDFAALRNSRS
jgi:protein SCO1/2